MWPPPENELEQSTYNGGPKLNVQWPPPEFEEQSQQKSEVIQTHFAPRARQIQWPPLRPGQEASECKIQLL